MDNLLGILPYIYFEEPVKLGDVAFLSLPDWQGRDHAPATNFDKRYLGELSNCFPTTRGLSTDKGGIKALTYFLLNTARGKEAQTLKQARKAVSLLRYTMLRPDTQALDNVESTYIYAFALPPAGGSDYRLYQCWPNLNIEHEIWISPEHKKFPSPGWYVDLQLIHTSQLEDVEAINQRFYEQRTLEQEDEVVLAIDWYNQSFLRYSISNIARRLVDVSIAFETFFQLQKNKITLKEAIIQTLGATRDSPIEHWAGAFYGRVRSATTHFGKPASLLYQHSNAETPHLSFLWFSSAFSGNAFQPKQDYLDIPTTID